MKAGTEDRRKLIAASSFGVLAVGYLLYTLIGTGRSADAPQPPAAVSTRAATAAAAPPTVTRSSPSRQDPVLHPEGMLLAESLVYTGSGRNLFLPPGASPAQTAAASIPRPLATPRYTPATPVVTGPPPLPPIDLRFLGTATGRDGKREAFLLRGEDVLLAASGETVARRYRVGQITSNTVEVTDLATNNTQRLPMSAQ